MQCPQCGDDRDRVVDSRRAENGAAVRRRRECLTCATRFSTVERGERARLVVRKRSGRGEPFDQAKLRSGMAKATNLPLGHPALREATREVEDAVHTSGHGEVSSDEIGEAVLAALRRLDPVAYLRFASVYRRFATLQDFRDELALLDDDAPRRRRTSGPSGAQRSVGPGDTT